MTTPSDSSSDASDQGRRDSWAPGEGLRWWRSGGRPRRRPPWWPEDEPWPPRWQGGPPRFARRYVARLSCLVMLFGLFGIGGCTLVFWLVASAAGLIDLPESARLLVRGLSLAALLIGFAGMAFTGRALRSVAGGLRDLIEAVGRVADGDYAARVRERGPRDVRAVASAFNRMAARLEANEAQRRSLLADVTHELRTPLTVMQGNLEGVIDGVYPADPEHLAPILDETRVLARLIDDLRTLTEAESGTLTLHREPTDLGVLAGETVAAFRPGAESAGVRLDLAMADDLPLLSVDPVRLREVLNNLVANALRYTPAGGTITVSGRPGPEGGVVLTVTDTGAGIAPGALPHIFDRFYKTPDSRGTGLGLAIARDLAAAHGGTVDVESEVGRGTTMRVKLPGEG
jgi:signal transduction histidine kinase